MRRSVLAVLAVAALLAAALGLVTNYASAQVPSFFTDDPWRVWLVFGLLVLAGLVVALIAARLRERVLGADHPNTLASRNNLAVALGALHEHRQAAELHRATLTARERVLGPDHPDTLNSRHNLASALGGLGEHRQAADLHRATLTACERVLGPDHPHTLTSRNNLADALGALREHRQAADLLRITIAARERILGPDHPDTLNSRANLAHAEAALARRPWLRLRRPRHDPARVDDPAPG